MTKQSINVSSGDNLGLNRVNEGQWFKLPPISLEELALELDPLKTDSVQEALHGIHAHDDTERDIEEQEHSDQDDWNVSTGDTSSDGLLQEHFTQLTVGQTQGPKTQVRGRVGNTPQDELDRLDDLVDSDLTDVMLFLVTSVLLLIRTFPGVLVLTRVKILPSGLHILLLPLVERIPQLLSQVVLGNLILMAL